MSTQDAAGYDPNKYKPENLQSWLNPAQYAEYQQLIAQAQPLFLGGEQFNYYRYLTDPSYSSLIQTQLERDPARKDAKSLALNNILDFFRRTSSQNLDPGRQPIDVAALFNPLKSSITDYANQARTSGQQLINRESQGATERAQEGLAGTGLGRSGAAAGGFASIENQRQGAVERLLSRVSDYEMQQKMAVDQRIAEGKLSEELRTRGVNQAQIDSAIAFQRGLYQMQYGQLLEMSADAQKDFWDTWGQIIGAGVGAAGQIIAA